MPARFPVHAQTGVRVNAAHKEQAMKRKKILEAEGKRASLLREEPFFYARDSVEYKAHLMIWGTKGKDRVVEVETFKN